MADDFKYHIDHHSSLVPPLELVEARGAFDRGELDDGGLRAAADRAVADVLLMQRRIGLNALSDGEFHRRDWLTPVCDQIAGLTASADGSSMGRLVGPLHAPVTYRVDAPLHAKARLLKEETESLLAATERSTMIALPSPGFLAELFATPGDAVAAGRDLAAILRAEVSAVAADGVRHVLVRNPAYGFLLRAGGRARAHEHGAEPDEVLARMMATDAALVDELATPAEFQVSLDITTGGLVGGDYDTDAVRGFGRTQPYRRVCVEFPEQPAYRFPITELASGTVVSLGVVDVGRAEAEDVDALVARIDEAAKLVDIDDIAISTNGGFHTAPTRTQDEVRFHLQAVEMTARYFWGNEL